MDAKNFGQLLKDHPVILDDAKLFAAILKDVYPNEKGNVNLMILSHNAGIVSVLRGGKLDDLLSDQIMNLLTGDYFIAEDKARWAAELWCEAYSFYTAGVFPLPRPQPSQPAPVQQPVSLRKSSSSYVETRAVRDRDKYAITEYIGPPEVLPTSRPQSSQSASVWRAVPLRESNPSYFQTEVNGRNCAITKYIGPRNGQVVIPAIIDGRPVTQISEFAFFDCTSLTSIHIQDSVTNIDSYTFQHCTSLSSIHIPSSVSYIGYKAFSGCPSLTVYAPANSYARKYCTQNNIRFQVV